LKSKSKAFIIYSKYLATSFNYFRIQIYESNQNLTIGSTVLQVVAKNSQGEEFFPTQSDMRQNVGFLVIDGLNRQITTFLHQFGKFHW
jgi:hypothetical protein